MTSGVTGSPLSGTLTPGPKFWRDWVGADGRYETSGGTTRAKWNSYSLSRESGLCTRDTIRISGRTDQFGSPPDSTVYQELGVTASGFNNMQSVGPASQLKALSRLLEKVKEHDFDLGVNLGQMKQTVDLLSNNLNKIGLAILQLGAGNVAGAARQLGARPRGTRLHVDDISGRWLELMYGWLPLLGDSFEAAKAFEAISKGPRTKLFRTSVWESRSADLSASTGQYSLAVKGKAHRYIQFELSEEMGFARQLGLLDPASVLWELTPWSFVVDWFIPIGTYLDVLNQVPSLQGRWLITDVVKYPLQRAVCNLTYPGSTYVWFGYNLCNQVKLVTPCELNYSAVRLSRSATFSPPSVPKPRFKLSGAIHGRRFWNAVSLGHQRVASVIDTQSQSVARAGRVRTRYRRPRRGWRPYFSP